MVIITLTRGAARAFPAHVYLFSGLILSEHVRKASDCAASHKRFTSNTQRCGKNFLSSRDGRECQDHFGLSIISLNSFFGLYSFKDFKEQVSLVQSSRIGSNIYTDPM